MNLSFKPYYNYHPEFGHITRGKPNNLKKLAMRNIFNRMEIRIEENGRQVAICGTKPTYCYRPNQLTLGL